MLLAYGLPKQTITTIMIRYKSTKATVHSSDGDTNSFDSVAGVLQKDTLALYLFIICLDYVLLMSIHLRTENGFTLKKQTKKQTIFI